MVAFGCVGSPSSLIPSTGVVGGLVCESVGKSDLLPDHNDSKQSRDSVDLPSSCHPSASFITFAFRSNEVVRLLLELAPMVQYPLSNILRGRLTFWFLYLSGISAASSFGYFSSFLVTDLCHSYPKGLQFL